VDGNCGNYGRPNWLGADSIFRTKYRDIEILIRKTDAAACELAAEGIVIDYLHVDASHSFEDSLKDFEMFHELLTDKALVTFHDTRPHAHRNVTCWQTVDELRKRGFDLVDLPFVGSGVAIIRPGK
jgi:hypothetical protein